MARYRCLLAEGLKIKRNSNSCTSLTCRPEAAAVNLSSVEIKETVASTVAIGFYSMQGICPNLSIGTLARWK